MEVEVNSFKQHSTIESTEVVNYSVTMETSLWNQCPENYHSLRSPGMWKMLLTITCTLTEMLKLVKYFCLYQLFAGLKSCSFHIVTVGTSFF